MTKEIKYNKSRLIAPANQNCVPVPIAWIEQVLATTDVTKPSLQAYDHRVWKLIGVIETARCFLLKK